MILNSRAYLLLMILLVLSACEKEVDIDVPAGEDQLVVEGQIEAGNQPLVLVSRSRGFFEPTSSESIAEAYISDATVKVNDTELQKVCTDDLPDSLAAQIAGALGISPGQLAHFNLCAYLGSSPETLGQQNTTYNLEVIVEDEVLTSTTHIPHRIEPDSVWFDLWAQSERFGYIFANISDPDTLDNAYRAFTRRIGENYNDNPTDAVFFAPFGSVYLDEFFNGTTSEVFFSRGQPPNSDRETDMGDEAGFFELGDRMVLKLCTTTEPVYDFYSTFEAQQGTNGSPFSAPANVISNINGGLGVWAGYACTFDTLRAE